MTVENQANRLKDLAQQVSDRYDADVFAYVGMLFEPYDDRVLAVCRERKKKRKNVLLILSTPGGSADAAYRIARCFQRCYCTDVANIADRGSFIIYVHDVCASAGTLLALGATNIIMSQKAQLGPIDVQLRREDEVGERRSGLTTRQALETLSNEAASAFGRIFAHMRFNRSTQLPTKMAGELAAEMAVRVMEPIYAQIDPMKLGETERLVRISQEYGERLCTSNVRKQAIGRLLGAYPSHEFVIDREEAGQELFHKIGKPTDGLEEIADAIIRGANPSDERAVFLNFISQELIQINEEADNEEGADPALGEGVEGEEPDGGQVRSESDGSSLAKGQEHSDTPEQHGERSHRRTGQNGARPHSS